VRNMTCEYAVYFKLLLLCGYTEELQQYIEDALTEQDPLSDVILELSLIGKDSKKMLSVLNKYILSFKDSDIDYDKTVFSLVMSFIKKKYADEAMPRKDIAELMYELAVHTERYFDEPWQTMYFMGDLFYEAEVGYIDKIDFLNKFDAFIKDEICFSDYPDVIPQESFFKRLLRKLRIIR